MLNKLFVISAPSGTGKSTLIKNLLQCNDFLSCIQLSVSYTTRSKRSGEIHGKDYFFISKKEFKYMIDNHMFFEYAKVFNYYYGTSKNNIKAMLNAGLNVILNIDWKGAQQIRSQISNVNTIFILPPSKEELERRLRFRGKDTEKTIFYRIQQAKQEISHIIEYDYVIVNDKFNIALIHLKAIILSEQLRITYQKNRYTNLIDDLSS